jgi:hypothetical protein
MDRTLNGANLPPEDSKATGDAMKNLPAGRQAEAG